MIASQTSEIHMQINKDIHERETNLEIDSFLCSMGFSIDR